MDDISTRKLSIGERVKVHVSSFLDYKSMANGHTCVITDVMKTSFALTSLYKYQLDWLESDNPGKSFPMCFDGYYYLDTDVTPLSSLYLVMAEKETLPDV